MARGEKPAVSLTARRKDAPRGSKARISIAAAWPGKYPDSYNASMDRGVKEIVLRDGTVLRPEDHWFDLKVWGQAKREEGW